MGKSYTTYCSDFSFVNISHLDKRFKIKAYKLLVGRNHFSKFFTIYFNPISNSIIYVSKKY